MRNIRGLLWGSRLTSRAHGNQPSLENINMRGTPGTSILPSEPIYRIIPVLTSLPSTILHGFFFRTLRSRQTPHASSVYLVPLKQGTKEPGSSCSILNLNLHPVQCPGIRTWGFNALSPSIEFCSLEASPSARWKPPMTA